MKLAELDEMEEILESLISQKMGKAIHNEGWRWCKNMCDQILDLEKLFTQLRCYCEDYKGGN